ncbi:MAG: amidohydrolase family protein [Planctomycetota bacterium]|nr:amidohydrolase family protein [Planctomycetota bacterium]
MATEKVTVPGVTSPVTDAHVHVQPWGQLLPQAKSLLRAGRADLEEIDRLFRDPEAFLEHIEGQGIRRAALINYVAPEVMGFTEEVNDFISTFCKGRTDRLIPFGGVEPRRDKGQVADSMDRIVGDLGIRGIKLHPPHQLYAANAYSNGEVSGLATVYEKAQEAGIPVMIHTGTSVFPGARSRLGDPMAADDIAVDFRDLKIILAHGGRPIWMETCFFLVRRHPNVYLDISSLPPKRLLDYFPRLEKIASKVLFGTDWPAPGVEGIAKNLEEFRALPLGDEAKTEILSRAAESVFGPAA